MKKVFLLVLILVSLRLQAANYYVASNGSDSNDGLTTGTAWQTLTKVNAATFVANDQILFRRGDTFYGQIIPKFIGTNAPIIYGSYGTGAKPILTGFSTVSAWTNLGLNIWESTSAVSALSDCNMVTISGVPTAMGREPESGYTYTVDSHTSYTTIVSASMGSATDWTGAQVVNRLIHWTWKVGTIIGQTGTTITYSDGGTTEPRDGYGFFIQNDPRTLDVQNEWYYNPTTKKIRVYSTSQPSSVKLSTIDIGVKSANNGERWNITIQDLMFTGYNQESIYAMNFNNVVISGCTFDKVGFSGVKVEGTDTYTITNNIFKNCNWCAVDATPATNINNNGIITLNTIDSTSMLLGVNRDFEPAAIKDNSDTLLVQYNSIDHSGYNGVYTKSQHGQIRNNFINNSLQNRSDGGGVYTAGSNVALVIDGNVILNSKGYAVGDGISYLGARGIYLDTGTKYITVSNNSCAYNWEGIYISTSADHTTISGNTCYENIASQIHFNNNQNTTDPGNDGDTELNTLTNNTFVSKTAAYPVALWTSTNNTIPSMLSSSSGNIYARPIDDNTTFSVQQPSTVGSYSRTLAEWKTFSSDDSNATKSPKVAMLESDVIFAYNETNAPKAVAIANPGMGMDGTTRYASSFTLQSYTSVVVLKDLPNPTGINKQQKSNLGRPMKTSSGIPIYTN